MRQATETLSRDLPRVVGARRLLASGRLGAELVRISETAAEMDRADRARLAPSEASERPMPTPEWILLSGDRR